MRSFILYSFTFPVVMARIRELFFFSLIQKRDRLNIPGYFGSSQDISALLDVMFATVRFVGLSGNTARKKSTNCDFELCSLINNCKKRI